MPENSLPLKALRQFSDEDILTLLRLRPDLATPPPGSLPGLVARALTRPSLERALGGLNTFHLQVLEATAALAHSLPQRAVTAAAVRRALGGKLPAAVVQEAIAQLSAQFLVTGSQRNLAISPAVWAALGPFPAGLGPSLAETLKQRADLSAEEKELWTAQLTDPEHVTELLTQAPPEAREVLNLLTWGPPIGNRGSGQTSDNSPLLWLIEHGLLATAGDSHVVLPREVALILRDGHTHREVSSGPPKLDEKLPTGYRPGRQSAQEFADTSAAERVVEVLQLVELLLEEWADGGPSLRTGGIGVREVRRLAAVLKLEETHTALLIEVAATAQLLALRESDEAWVPSREQLIWQQLTPAEQWVQLVWAWLQSPRATWLIGQREQGQIISPLQPGIDRAWVPNLRQATLTVCAQTTPGAVLNNDDIYAQLKWKSPRSAPHERAVKTFLAHAQWLGVLGAGALTTSARHLLDAARAGDLAEEDRALAGAVAGIDTAISPEVNEVLVQGDLSIVVPGRPAAELAWLWQVAEAEQRGSAQVLRLTEDSVKAALDAGWQGAEILERLTAASPTEIPQPVSYLIADVERHHGRVRVEAAQAVITTADPAAAAAITADKELAGLQLKQVAPTVLISQLPLVEVLATLRAHGHSPVTSHRAGDPARAARRRPSARGSLQVGQPVSIALDDAAPHRALMAIRAAEDQAKTGAPDPLIARQLLTALHTSGRAGWITLVDGKGHTQRRLVAVLGISSGRARLKDMERESELVVQLHRIVTVD